MWSLPKGWKYVREPCSSEKYQLLKCSSVQKTEVEKTFRSANGADSKQQPERVSSSFFWFSLKMSRSFSWSGVKLFHVLRSAGSSKSHQKLHKHKTSAQNPPKNHHFGTSTSTSTTHLLGLQAEEISSQQQRAVGPNEHRRTASYARRDAVAAEVVGLGLPGRMKPPNCSSSRRANESILKMFEANESYKSSERSR